MTWNHKYLDKLTSAGQTMTPGWPDEEHGISWDAYCDWAIGLIEKLEEGSDIGSFQSFDEWKDMRRDEDPDRDNLGFRAQSCDLCGALPGDRHAATLLNPEDGSYHPYEVCNLCILYISNGDTPQE